MTRYREGLQPGSYLAILSPSTSHMVGALVEEVAVGTVLHDDQGGNTHRQQRWKRMRRAELLDQYGSLQAQGISQRQAAELLDVPRTTLQAWRAWQDRLDACPQVVAFFESVPGLAFLHRFVLALHVVYIEIGACGIRLVC